MAKRILFVGVLIEDEVAVARLDQLLCDYMPYILNQVTSCHPQTGMKIVSITIDAPVGISNTILVQMRQLAGLQVSTAYSNELIEG